MRERCADTTHAKFDALQRDIVAAMNEDGAEAPAGQVLDMHPEIQALLEQAPALLEVGIENLGDRLAAVVRKTINDIRAETPGA